MPDYPFMWVDAFTNSAMGGNPCAVLFETDDLDDQMMQRIAFEMNLSETAFVRRSKVADFGARYFTPAEEIPLAGHPTIATVFALVDSGRLPLQGERTTMTLELRVGPIPIEIFAQDGQVQRIVMTQKKPQFLATYDPAQVMPIFGLSPADLLSDLPIQTVSTGTPQLMIPIRDHEALRRLQVDHPVYTRFRAEADFFSPHLFCLGGVTGAGDTFARHPCVPPDTTEDPFTGSATGGMAAYLWRYSLLEKPQFMAEQGHWLNRPGQAVVEVVGPRENIEAVKVGGQAVGLIRGSLSL
jgi:trans-2,3-dihydro-3-hydroxyanthranilate isomerase